jgi:hypothetical protein
VPRALSYFFVAQRHPFPQPHAVLQPHGASQAQRSAVPPQPQSVVWQRQFSVSVVFIMVVSLF